VGADRVAKALQRAEELVRSVGQDQLAALARQTEPLQRLLALALMRKQIAHGAPASGYLLLAHPLVEDPDPDCRWQALIVIGESVTTHPEEVWRVVLAHGGSMDEDLRMGVATVLLEHLLEEHFEEYFPKVRAEVQRGSKLFAEMVRNCWFDGCSGVRYRQMQQLLRNAARAGFRGTE
jgi:hypothetical protein